MPPIAMPSRRLHAVLLVVFAAGLVRALALWAHVPLYAYANSYDETRYSACFSIYPNRPAEIPPQQNSPLAPIEDFRFVATGDPLCYWSSELLFTGATALAWRALEAAGGPPVHSVRAIGALKLAALLMLVAGFVRAHLRRGEPRPALAHALLFALVFADPGNTLYLNTFYGEWTALLAAYALFALIALWHGEAFDRRRFAWLALTAFVLATSKIQHLLLPLALATGLYALARLDRRRAGWRAAAVLCGALAGAGFQFAQLQRDDAMSDSIRQYNRADVVFTALLPLADDPRTLLADIGIDPACAIYAGKHAWELPDMPERACPGITRFGQARLLATLARHPGIVLRLPLHGLRALDPWLARNVGHVAGAELASIPPALSIGSALHAWPPLQWAVLATPLLALGALARRRTRSRAVVEYLGLTVVLMAATLAVTVLGDGLADTAKQGHLVVDAALCALVVLVCLYRRRAPTSVPGDA